MDGGMVMMMDRVVVAVHADDPISRAGLIAQLRHRPEVRLQHEDAEPEGGVAVVLADEVDENVLRTVKALRRCSSSRVVLVVTRLGDAALLATVEAGVSSLLHRGSATVDAIVEAVQSAARGSGCMPPDLLGRLLEQVGRLQRDVLSPRGLNASGLTDRETKVLRLIADGCDTAEVGRRLFFSERTIKNIIHDITSRLQLRNRTHAVAYAVRQGLI
jgi:DNA-binding NarL/FixJ family response regulator